MPLNVRKYICNICDNQNPDQKSHNTSHKRTNKHKLFRLELEKKMKKNC